MVMNMFVIAKNPASRMLVLPNIISTILQHLDECGKSLEKTDITQNSTDNVSCTCQQHLNYLKLKCLFICSQYLYVGIHYWNSHMWIDCQRTAAKVSDFECLGNEVKAVEKFSNNILNCSLLTRGRNIRSAIASAGKYLKIDWFIWPMNKSSFASKTTT